MKNFLFFTLVAILPLSIFGQSKPSTSKPAPAKTTTAPKPAPAKTTTAPKPAPAKTTTAPKPAPAKTTTAPKPAPAPASAWKLVSDPYKKSKEIVTTAYRRDQSYIQRQITIKKSSSSGKYYWAMMDGQYLAYNPDRVSILTVYVMINGELQEFLCYYDNPMAITDEIFSALQKGTMATFQFTGIPYYYEFSLQGFNESLKLLD